MTYYSNLVEDKDRFYALTLTWDAIYGLGIYKDFAIEKGGVYVLPDVGFSYDDFYYIHDWVGTVIYHPHKYKIKIKNQFGNTLRFELTHYGEFLALGGDRYGFFEFQSEGDPFSNDNKMFLALGMRILDTYLDTLWERPFLADKDKEQP